MKRKIVVWLAVLVLAGCVNGTPFEPEMCIITMNADGEWVYPEGFTLERCIVYPIKTTTKRKG